MFIMKCSYFLILPIFIASFTWSNRIESIKAAQLSWELPIVDTEADSVFKWTGTCKLFFYKDITLYEKEELLIHEDNHEEKISTYWIYRPTNKKGYKFKGLFKDSVGTEFDVDSFLVKNAFKSFPFYNKENDDIVSSKTAENGRELIEKYIPKVKLDNSYPDTTTFRYSKDLRDIPFSFSSEMEAGKKTKLVEITGIFNPVSNSKYSAQSKTRIMSFQMERILVVNPQEKKLYFEWFEKRSGHMK